MSEAEAGERQGRTANTQPSSIQPVAFDLIEFCIVLAQNKKLVFVVPLVGALVAGIITMLMPNVYTATARILPPQQSQSATMAMLGQLAGLGAGLTLPGLKNPSDLYIGMLRSRTIADRVIERFSLKVVYGAETAVETRQALAAVTSVSTGKDGIIKIEVEDEDPDRAAAIANAYTEELDTLNGSLAITEAAQRRLFFERQLQQAKRDLAGAEIELKKTQEKTGLIKLDEQGRAIIEGIAQLRAQVVAKEVQIVAMRSFATEQHPELARAQQELSGLRAQLRKMERAQLAGDGDILVPADQVPQAGLEYLRSLREVKYQEALFELVAKQYEFARLDESREASLIQVLDRAIAPDSKSGPKRGLIVVLTGVVLGLLCAFWAFLRHGRELDGTLVQRRERMGLLKAHMFGKSKQ